VSYSNAYCSVALVVPIIVLCLEFYNFTAAVTVWTTAGHA